MRAATRVQETPCAHLTTSVDIHLILICVPEDFNILTVKNSHPEAIQDSYDYKRRVTVLTRWDDDPQRTLLSCIAFIYIQTHTHAGGRHVLLGFLQREEILQRKFTGLSVHFSVKKQTNKEKKKKTSTWLSKHLLFSCVRFFEDYRSANKQRLLNVYSVMLLYILYYGPRQLGNQAYFKWVRGKGGGGSIFKHYDDKNHKPPSTRYTSVQMDTV